MKPRMWLWKKIRQPDQADTVDQEVQDDREVDHFHQEDTQDHQNDLTREAALVPDHRRSTFFQQGNKDLLHILWY